MQTQKFPKQIKTANILLLLSPCFIAVRFILNMDDRFNPVEYLIHGGLGLMPWILVYFIRQGKIWPRLILISLVVLTLLGNFFTFFIFLDGIAGLANLIHIATLATASILLYSKPANDYYKSKPQIFYEDELIDQVK